MRDNRPTGAEPRIGEEPVDEPDSFTELDLVPDLDLVVELPFTEAELTELAMAADPSLPMDDDAVPLAEYLGQNEGLLPLWYMPSPMVRGGSRWRLPVVLVIVGAFVIIEALGLCSTFGQLVPA